MTITTTFEDAVAILHCFNDFTHEGMSHDDIWWRTDSEYAPITFFVNCNDLFVWGCADCEEITGVDIVAVHQAHEDAKDEKGFTSSAHLLWVARKRGYRPQVAYYNYFTEKEKVLFDACGTAEEQYGNMDNPRYKKFVERNKDAEVKL